MPSSRSSARSLRAACTAVAREGRPFCSHLIMRFASSANGSKSRTHFATSWLRTLLDTTAGPQPTRARQVPINHSYNDAKDFLSGPAIGLGILCFTTAFQGFACDLHTIRASVILDIIFAIRSRLKERAYEGIL